VNGCMGELPGTTTTGTTCETMPLLLARAYPCVGLGLTPLVVPQEPSHKPCSAKQKAVNVRPEKGFFADGLEAVPHSLGCVHEPRQTQCSRHSDLAMEGRLLYERATQYPRCG
jgi:hypothetical protein